MPMYADKPWADPKHKSYHYAKVANCLECGVKCSVSAWGKWCFHCNVKRMGRLSTQFDILEQSLLVGKATDELHKPK